MPHRSEARDSLEPLASDPRTEADLYRALPGDPDRSIAAIDLGSNSFHMVVSRLADGEPIRLDRDREMVRLGAGLDARGRLTAEAQERALGCLGRFGERLAGIASENVRAVGTNTLRRTRDPTFLAAAEAALGHPIEVISGIEEARLIYLGVARSVAGGSQRRLVIDIGGGSTELIIGERSEPLVLESLYMGCVSSTLRFFPDGVVTAKRWRKAVLFALQELEPVVSLFKATGWSEAVGSSGTVRAVGRVVTNAGWSDYGITPASLSKLGAALIEAGSSDRLSVSGVSTDRAPVFAAGAATLTGVMEALSIDRLQVADGALREGVLYDLLGRLGHEDTRDRTVRWLARRYHVDEGQASRVEATALRLFDEVATEWKLGRLDREILGWAATLHEIGLDIAHSHYHRHGGYIIENGDLPGFSLRDQALTATLVASHRRRVVASRFKGKPVSWLRLAVLLRMAVVLHRSRVGSDSPPVRFSVSDMTLTMRFPDGWLEEHPLIRADFVQENKDLGATGFHVEI